MTKKTVKKTAKPLSDEYKKGYADAYKAFQEEIDALRKSFKRMLRDAAEEVKRVAACEADPDDYAFIAEVHIGFRKWMKGWLKHHQQKWEDDINEL